MSKDKKSKKEKPPHLSTSKSSKPRSLPPQKNGKKLGKQTDVTENDFLTFGQKKGLEELFGFDDNDVSIARTVSSNRRGVART